MKSFIITTLLLLLVALPLANAYWDCQKQYDCTIDQVRNFIRPFLSAKEHCLEKVVCPSKSSTAPFASEILHAGDDAAATTSFDTSIESGKLKVNTATIVHTPSSLVTLLLLGPEVILPRNYSPRRSKVKLFLPLPLSNLTGHSFLPLAPNMILPRKRSPRQSKVMCSYKQPSLFCFLFVDLFAPELTFPWKYSPH